MVYFYQKFFTMNLQLKEPFILLLIGAPLSGKSTFVKGFTKYKFDLISRDDILMQEYEKLGYLDNSYKKAWDIVNHKNINKMLESTIDYLKKSDTNIIVDMTNMRSKKRKFILNKFPNHNRYALVFPFLKKEEYEKRNEKRFLEENKHINYNIIDSMINSFQELSPDENYNKIYHIKS